MFAAAFIISIILGVIFIAISLLMYHDGDTQLGTYFLIGGIACILIFSGLMGNIEKVESIYYVDEYNLTQIKEELDVKEVKGTTIQISVKEREYLKIYLNRLDDELYYEYAIHQNEIQLEDFEQYKIKDRE